MNLYNSRMPNSHAELAEPGIAPDLRSPFLSFRCASTAVDGTPNADGVEGKERKALGFTIIDLRSMVPRTRFAAFREERKPK